MSENFNPPDNFTDLGEAVVAKEVQDEFEAEILISKLNSCGIPAYLRHSQFGEVAKVYCGRSNFPISIMVPSSKLSEALEILSDNGGEFDFSEAEDFPPPDDKINFPYKATFTILGALAILLIILYGIFNQL